MQFPRSMSTSLAPLADSVDGITDAKHRRAPGGQPDARVGAGSPTSRSVLPSSNPTVTARVCEMALASTVNGPTTWGARTPRSR